MGEAALASEISVDMRLDPFIAEGMDRQFDRAQILNIHRTSTGVLLGNPDKASPLACGQPSMKWVLIIVIAAFAISWLAVTFVGQLALIGVIAAALAPIATSLFDAWNGLKRRRLRSRLREAAAVAHSRERLRAYLHADDTAEIDAMTDTPFEPVVIRRERLILKGRYVFPISVLASAVLILLIRPILPFHWIYLVWFILTPSGLIALWLYPRANPWYYRITPGRMDLIRFEPFRRNRAGTILREWDLREAWIEFFDGVISLRPTAANADAFEIKVGELGEPQAFVYALFRGAVSSYDAPALPVDRLS